MSQVVAEVGASGKVRAVALAVGPPMVQAEEPDMVSSLAAIPLDGAPPTDEMDAVPAAEALGLLARPVEAPDAARRMEDWIASYIDLSDGPAPEGVRRSIWDHLIDRLPTARSSGQKRPTPGGSETAFAEWSRFRVAYRGGITIVRPIDPSLVKEAHVRELARDLIELVEAGNRRLLVDFRAVDKVGSWLALAIDEVHRRATDDGGVLKICGLSDEQAAILDLAGMASGIERHPDEGSAMASAWPLPSASQALPIEILKALATGPPLPPICGGAPVEEAESRRNGPRPTDSTRLGLWLIVRIGSSEGRPIPVAGPTFLIGRQADCQLRIRSPMVSKQHATIERRDGRIVLADLGSTNGTYLNGRRLRDRTAEIHEGDRIQLGPVVCTVATAARREAPIRVEQQVAGWLHADDRPCPATGGEPDTAILAATGDAPDRDDGPADIRAEIIQGVLIITPETGELENEATIDRFRKHLHATLEEALPRRVVVNLEYVAHLTGQAIGVLLAHHLRLDQAGGTLRICQPRARIMAILHRVRLTMLIDCHPTLDEAVLSAWGRKSPSR